MELAIPFAAFLVRRGRLDAAQRLLDELRGFLNGTGAALLERQVAGVCFRHVRLVPGELTPEL